jgi:hypothetical protein
MDAAHEGRGIDVEEVGEDAHVVFLMLSVFDRIP